MQNNNSHIKVSQISIGRFHHFHLARQLERYGILNKIYTGYPKFKLKDERGINQNKVITFPWLQTPYMMRGKFGLDNWQWLDRELAWQAKESLDKYVAKRLRDETHLIALSSVGLHSGKTIKDRGGVYICDRGSSHIQYQNNILQQEYKNYGFHFKGIDPRVIHKELEEYELADYITVPSEFVKKSFIEMGVRESKIIKLPYGARLDRFSKIDEPSKDIFRVLWVGGVSIRKGFMYAFEAFKRLRYHRKEFVVIGAISQEVKSLLSKIDTSEVIFKGLIDNAKLVEQYSQASVFVLPSLEEGLAMVQGEALSCGCPVIASDNTGASDLFENGKDGFIIPIRDIHQLTDKIQLLADNPKLRSEMSNNAINRMKSLGGWDNYGDGIYKFLIKEFYR